MADTGNEAPENGPPATDTDALPARKVWKGTHYPTATDFPDGNCVIGKGSSLTPQSDSPEWEWVISNCRFEKGAKIRLANSEKKSRKSKGHTSKKETPVAEMPVAEETVMAPTEEEVVPLQAAPAPAALTVAPPAPVQTEAVVGVDQAVAQMKALLPASAQNHPGLMVGGAAGLALIGAGIKFAPQIMKMLNAKSEKLHELEMKKLELEEKKQEKSEEGHSKCESARMVLSAKASVAEAKAEAAEAKAAELAQKLEELEKRVEAKAAEASALDFDPEDLEARLKKLEKALKAKPAAKKK